MRRVGSRCKGEDFEFRERVRADLEQAAGVGQLVDLVEHHDGLLDAPAEQHWFAHHVLHGG
jgi:hypothetical protein